MGRWCSSTCSALRAIQEGWTFGSLEFGDDTVRSAYILLGALKVPVLEGLLFKISLEFDKIDPASMAGQLGDLLAESIEGAKPEGEAPKAKQAPGGKSALLRELDATAGELQAAHEVAQVMDSVGRFATALKRPLRLARGSGAGGLGASRRRCATLEVREDSED